jgi:hypothetical protein
MMCLGLRSCASAKAQRRHAVEHAIVPNQPMEKRGAKMGDDVAPASI